MNAPLSQAGRDRRPMANLTPMIDVVFQLIIFFMLAAQFSSQQSIELELPSVDDPEAAIFDHEGRAVVNLVPEERVSELGGAYRLGTRTYASTPEGARRLVGVLERLGNEEEDLRVVVRAGRIESYERVHPLLQALTLAHVLEVDLAVRRASGGGAPR